MLDLDAIEKRTQGRIARRPTWGSEFEYDAAHEMIPTLVAEVRRLREELEKRKESR